MRFKDAPSSVECCVSSSIDRQVAGMIDAFWASGIGENFSVAEDRLRKGLRILRQEETRLLAILNDELKK